MQTYRRTWEKFSQPGSYQTRPYPVPPNTKAQRVSMQLSLSYWDLAKLTGDATVREHAMRLTDADVARYLAAHEDERAKPYGWRWADDAVPRAIRPRMPCRMVN